MSKLLFVADEWEFYDNGMAIDRVKEVFGKPKPTPYCISPMDNPGDEACVFWVWDDKTMSLAHDNIQSAYRAYVLKEVVK